MIAPEALDTPTVIVVDDWFLDAPDAPEPTPTPTPAPVPTATPTTLPETLKPHPLWARYPLWLRDFGRCVMRHESGGDPRAENASSTASGLFQFVDGTWSAWAQRSGIGTRYSHAANAPTAVQVDVFAYAVQHKGARAWVGTSCGMGT